MKKPLLFGGLCGLLFACKNNSEEKTTQTEDGEYELLEKAQSLFQRISALYMREPDHDKVDVGKHLVFDTRLSGEGNISCNSCHNLNTYGVDNERFSPGDAPGTIGNRNSPTVFHAALH